MAVYTQAEAPANVRAVPTDPIWRLSVAQYQQMARQGILTDDDAVELLEGWLVTKMPKNPPHRLSTQSLREVIAKDAPNTANEGHPRGYNPTLGSPCGE